MAISRGFSHLIVVNSGLSYTHHIFLVGWTMLNHISGRCRMTARWELQSSVPVGTVILINQNIIITMNSTINLGIRKNVRIWLKTSIIYIYTINFAYWSYVHQLSKQQTWDTTGRGFTRHLFAEVLFSQPAGWSVGGVRAEALLFFLVWYIYIWVNYNISLTWIVRPFGYDSPYLPWFQGLVAVRSL